jgi:hypothetical protein
MDRVLISWNLPNWITVMLMGALGYVALALLAQVFKWNGSGGGSATTVATGGSLPSMFGLVQP